MMNKNSIIRCLFYCSIICLLALFSACGTKRLGNDYPFRNESLPIDTRVNNLVSLLTLEEKISQMVNESPEIKRLNIPAHNWWNETLHGVARSPYNVTSYPQAIGLAACWDIDAMKQMADYCAVEGRAIFNDSQKKGKTGIYLGLTYWTPNINIFRDPRWGRGQETYGEDPYLTGSLGKAFVRGLEGDDPKYLKASACAKHFAVHSGPEWNRSTFNAVVTGYDLWNTYLPAFRDVIVEAKVSGVMCAYNAIDNQPCCGNDQLMNTILRKKWNFEGYVTSDCGGINHFWKTHKTSPTKEAAAATAVLHGTDCECSGDPAYRALSTALQQGLLTEEAINTSVSRLFTTRFRLGHFDRLSSNPFSKIGLSALESKPHQLHALKMAEESLVLLKNENNTLPLSRKLKKIAIVGPNADDESTLLANYYGYPSEVVSVLEGIKKEYKGDIVYEKGTNWLDNKVFISKYSKFSFSYNGKNGFQGQYFKNTKFEGKPSITKQDLKLDFQWGDGEKVAGDIIANSISIRWTTNFVTDADGLVTFELKGDDRCRMFVNDQKVIETDLKNGYYTFDAKKGTSYKIVIEYNQYSDNAEIKFDAGLIETTTPEAIATKIKEADAVIFVGGISAKLEGEAMPVDAAGFKGGDRTSIDLPAIQTELLKVLKQNGKPIVFINMSGGAMAFNWEAANLPAIIQAWYPGQAGGTAIANLIFGNYSPSGKLPVTFYKGITDLPSFEDYNMENRTYRFYKGEPLYPFGFGLSYTTFNYNSIQVEKQKGGKVFVKVAMSNTGNYDSDEVVQLYIKQIHTGAKSPIRSLKGFQRVHLKKGANKEITFTLDKEQLSFFDEKGNSHLINGLIEVNVGGGQFNQDQDKESKYASARIEL